MPKYLYGAAVQGIQDFIFQTNKLKEIMGASELVEKICTDCFADVLYGVPDAERLKKDPNAILNAAGNIKYMFDNVDECSRVARIFPKEIMEFAPGITISQSVVEIETDEDFGEAVQKLEKNLRAQRNRQVRDLNLGLMGILRSRQTGLPVTHIRERDGKTEYMDSATFHKLFEKKGKLFEEKWKRKETFELLCEKAFGRDVPIDKSRLPYNIEEMTGSNDWIAIIHADGNGLGQIVREIGSDKDTFREFSRKLDQATTMAAQRAFNDTVYKDLQGHDFIPVRPIVLSGDDHTVICRADLAIPYTEAFLKYFEEETEKELGGILSGVKADGKREKSVFADGSLKLTACAGIAFVKSSFPFHFGYRLAESLCDRAKKDTKTLYKATEGNLPASCLMFHKVQDSFVADFGDIAKRELMPQTDISFEFGPYYLKDTKQGRWTVTELREQSKRLRDKEGNAVKSHLRNWLTLLHENPAEADQKLDRLIEITNLSSFVKAIARKDGHKVRTREDGVTVYPVYDLLAVNTIDTQKTR
ncbi:MAG: hypothetical protein K2H38_13220 [Muribaculaceae bacterium]|nr:hypothetical protein [Muribaculaceae bacterium]